MMNLRDGRGGYGEGERACRRRGSDGRNRDGDGVHQRKREREQGMLAVKFQSEKARAQTRARHNHARCDSRRDSDVTRLMEDHVTSPCFMGLYLLDYGAGNVCSLANSLRKLGYSFQWISSPEDLNRATVSLHSPR